MNIWCDYSGGRPSGLSLQRAGVTGVIRYVGIGGMGKRLTRPEYEDLIAHGIIVHGVVERDTMDANGGYQAGLMNARAAVADIHAITSGRGLAVVYAANDQQAATSQTVAYVQGFSDILGVAYTGAYGFSAQIAAVRKAGFASHFWLAGHPPSLVNMSGEVDLWQRQGTKGQTSDGPATPTTIIIDGVQCDVNNAYLITTPPLPEEHDMMFISCAALNGELAVIVGGLVTGLDGETAGNYLAMVKSGTMPPPLAVSQTVWDDLVHKSQDLEDVAGKLDVANSTLVQVKGFLDRFAGDTITMAPPAAPYPVPSPGPTA